ncbi:MAG TPA: hypothetical protein VHB48_13170, partial [Chitinophagaceae bacterium]|nr:hypothetical protein [Chitinophagaceae bacterium]
MRILLLLVLVIMVLPANAQQYDKYIIQFTDKNNSPYTLSAPAEYLSVKAIERRTRYNIPPDSSDLPVNPQYIQAVLAKGNCRLLAQSKWLNDILIYTSDPSIIDSINTLPFVKKSQATGFLTTRINIPVTNKFYYESAQTQMPGTSYGNTGDTLQYASTYAQIHLHNGEFLHNKGYQGQGITIA